MFVHPGVSFLNDRVDQMVSLEFELVETEIFAQRVGEQDGIYDIPRFRLELILPRKVVLLHELPEHNGVQTNQVWPELLFGDNHLDFEIGSLDLEFYLLRRSDLRFPGLHTFSFEEN